MSENGHINLPSRFAFVSAWNTHLGSEIEGDEVMGLGKMFNGESAYARIQELNQFKKNKKYIKDILVVLELVLRKKEKEKCTFTVASL